MVSAEQFVGPNGSVRWGALAMVLVGAAWFALINGFIRMVFAFFGIVTAALDGSVRFAVTIVETVLGIPSATLLASWGQLRELVTTSEAFAFTFAVAVVLLMLWSIRGVVRGAA